MIDEDLLLRYDLYIYKGHIHIGYILCFDAAAQDATVLILL